jgi:hypothetical protein
VRREGRTTLLKHDQQSSSVIIGGNYKNNDENRNILMNNDGDPPTSSTSRRRVVLPRSNSPEAPAPCAQGEPPNAAVSGGCIDERYGRPLSLLLDAIRFLAAREFIGADDVRTIQDIERMRHPPPPPPAPQQNNQHQQHGHQHHQDAHHQARATARLNYFLAVGWSHWTDPGAYHARNGWGVREIAKQWVQVEWRQDVARQTKKEAHLLPVGGGLAGSTTVSAAATRSKRRHHQLERYRAMVQFCGDAFEHVRAAKSWHIRVHGDFWVVGGDDQGTYLIPQRNEDMVYQCVGLSTSLHEMIQRNDKYGTRPMVWKVTLIPFYGRLVYDGVVTLVGGSNIGGLAMAASESKTRKLLATVHEAIQNRRIVQRLLQLEVEGGSMKGLPTQGLNQVEKRSIATKEQPPPTSMEKKLLKAYTRIGNMMSTDDPKGLWVFRRKGYTEQENPEHVGLILGRGEAMGLFRCSHGLQPTSTDLLEAAMEAAANAGCRPHALLPDDYACYQRLKFLFETADDETTIKYYHPPTPEETAAALASADEGLF